MRRFFKRRASERDTSDGARVVYEPSKVYDNKLLAGRTALITGAGRNVGRSVALEMGRQGASLVIIDVNRARLDQVSNELKSEGIDVRSFVADVGREGAIDDLIAKLDDEKLVVDVLVNNVGIHEELDAIKAGDFSSWRVTFETNVVGPFRLTRKIVDRLIERELPGSVIFISSIHQWHVRGNAAYSASKASVGMIVKELADELASHRIRVNGIAPGVVLPTEDGVERVLPHVPLHGTATAPRYIGRSAVYLASEYFSRHTTGSVILIDAGILARGFHKGRAMPPRDEQENS